MNIIDKGLESRVLAELKANVKAEITIKLSYLDLISFIKGEESMLGEEPFYNILMRDAVWHLGMLPLGCVIAVCNLVHVKKMDEGHVFPACKGYGYDGRYWKLNEQERAFGHYAVGRYMWLLDDVRPLPEPFPAKGSLGFWEWSNGEVT